MCYRYIAILACAATTLVALSAGAQDTTAIDPNMVAQGVAWVCKNQSGATTVIIFLGGHLGFSALSATLKKYGVTADSPVIGNLVPIIRLLALDLKPPPAVLVAQGEKLQATGVVPVQPPPVVQPAKG